MVTLLTRALQPPCDLLLSRFLSERELLQALHLLIRRVKERPASCSVCSLSGADVCVFGLAVHRLSSDSLHLSASVAEFLCLSLSPSW